MSSFSKHTAQMYFHLGSVTALLKRDAAVAARLVVTKSADNWRHPQISEPLLAGFQEQRDLNTHKADLQASKEAQALCHRWIFLHEGGKTSWASTPGCRQALLGQINADFKFFVSVARGLCLSQQLVLNKSLNPTVINMIRKSCQALKTGLKTTINISLTSTYSSEHPGHTSGVSKAHLDKFPSFYWSPEKYPQHFDLFECHVLVWTLQPEAWQVKEALIQCPAYFTSPHSKYHSMINLI